MSKAIGITSLVIAWLAFLYMILGIAAGSGFAAFWGGIGLIVFGVVTKVCLTKSFGG